VVVSGYPTYIRCDVSSNDALDRQDNFAIPVTKEDIVKLGPGQRVIATANLRFGLFTSVPQGMTGTIVEVGGFFTTRCYVQWDNGEQGEVAGNLLAPIRR